MTIPDRLTVDSHLYVRSEEAMMRTIDIEYPRNNPDQSHVRVSLTDVRAADDIVIHYDFDRDGWVIESPTIHSWEAHDPVMDEGLKETAFVPAWPFETPTP